MIKILSKKRTLKRVALFMAANFLLSTLLPTASYALTNGPSQPEIQSFEPIGTSEMVNLFSGDFTYNIPLFELPGPNGGYPFNIAYNSGIGMDQEASWVGLGWNLQPGSMTRSMSGMPDEFNGDQVLKKMDIKEDRTLGMTRKVTTEVFGRKKNENGDKVVKENAKFKFTLNASLGIYNNTYKGMSTELSIGGNLSRSFALMDGDKHSLGLMTSVNSQITLNSQDGVDIGATGSVGLKYQMGKDEERRLGVDLTTDVGFNYNHKRGLQDTKMGLNGSLTIEEKKSKSDKESQDSQEADYTYVDRGSFSSRSSVPISRASRGGYNPQISMPFMSKSFAANFKSGGAFNGVYVSAGAGVSFSSQELKNANKWNAVPAFGYLNLQGSNDEQYENSILDFNREKDGIIRDESTNLWMPSMTYDSYSVTGHGMSGSFRPYRRDIGMIWDQTLKSENKGHTAAAELGLPGPRFGGNYGQINGYSESKRMDLFSSGLNYYKNNFQKNEGNNQMIYFKAHGEPTTKSLDAWDHIGDYAPLRFRKNTQNKKNYVFDPVLEDNNGGTTNFSSNGNLVLKEKEKRNSVVLPILNQDLITSNVHDNTNDNENTVPKTVLNEFQISYFDQTDGNELNLLGDEQLKNYDRTIKSVQNIGEGNDIKNDLEMNWLAENHVINKPHHVAGFLNVDPSGLRYVYGLPVYNTEQVDASFSATASLNAVTNDRKADVIDIPKEGSNILYKESQLNNGISSDEYLSKSKIPPYVYAHMLTAILGVDYVDADDIPGPSDGDLGYWVKFNYRKVADDFKWRTPFVGAKYNPGIQNTTKDDRASYTYGQKEVWYLATAETASHKAEFHISPRSDAHGAASELQNSNDSKIGHASYKLDKIVVRSKLDTKELQTIHLDYKKDNQPFTLCQNVLNSNASGASSGKLTLTKLYFEYRGNKMGSKTPYEFKYGGEQEYNPEYAPHNVDRWGNYRDLAEILGTNDEATAWQFQLDFPYVRQDIDRSLHDKYAGAWELSEIKLPSGGKIKVEYEADDYAYVQNKQAMYMTDIVAVSSSSVKLGYSGNDPMDFTTSMTQQPSSVTGGSTYDPMELYNKTEKKERNRIYFKLKDNVSQNITPEEHLKEVMKYVDDVSWQLYFKTKIDLHKANNSNFQEFIAGYAEIKKFDVTNIGGEAGLVGNENGKFTHAFITVKNVTKKNWHPISVGAWQHIQVNQPELYSSSPTVPGVGDSDKKKVGAALALLNMGEFIGQLSKGFYKWAGKRKRWGRHMIAGKSWIRLNVPDKIKVGGGTRVHKISLTDEWEFGDLLQTKKAEYGQVYDYTTTDANGNKISSGVAAYEPLMGGDEIAIRTARKFSSGVPLRNNNDFFFEYPINESFYPGPSVGYGKVTVVSLAVEANRVKAKAEADGEPLSIPGFHSTTGATVHEYYTAKDFPVITDEIDKNDKFGKPKVKFRIILTESVANSIATQGYTVIQNNMHGQQKKISNYALSEKGEILPEALSWIEYHFRSEKTEAHGLPALKLKNRVIALEADKDGEQTPILSERIIGEEMDFVVDARETEIFSETKEKSVNIDFNALPQIPIPTYFPSTSRTIVKTKAIVTNKIISRVGILDHVTAWTLGAKVTTYNDIWDAQTGEVVVSSVNNNFNDKVYTYNIPAHLKYEGLGPAYLNSGMKVNDVQFTGLIEEEDLYEADGINHQYKDDYYVIGANALTSSGVTVEDFYPGDEFIVRDQNGAVQTTMIYIGKEKEGSATEEASLSFYSKGEANLFDTPVSLFLFRSGRRNLLSAKVGSITSKINPLMEEKADGPLKVIDTETGEVKSYQARTRTSVDAKLPKIVLPDCPNNDCKGKSGE